MLRKILSLQSELDACKTSHEEETCKRLHEELEKLQEEYYRKQMKLQVARQSSHIKPPMKGCKNQQNQHHHSATNSPAHFMDDIMEDSTCQSQNDGDLDGNRDEDSWFNAEDIELDKDDMDAIEEGEWDEEKIVSSMFNDTSKQTWDEKVNDKQVWDEKVNDLKETVSYQKKFPPSYFAQRKMYKSSVNDYTEMADNFQAATNLVDLVNSTSERRRYDKERATSIKSRDSIDSPIRQKKFTSTPIDSPDPSLVTRKRPGESIYKAPGTHNLFSG